MSTRTRLSRDQELLVAVQASADPRTVRKVVAGEQVRGSVRHRIERVLAAMGLADGRPAQKEANES